MLTWEGIPWRLSRSPIVEMNPKKLDTNIKLLLGHEFGIEPDSCLLISP